MFPSPHYVRVRDVIYERTLETLLLLIMNVCVGNSQVAIKRDHLVGVACINLTKI